VKRIEPLALAALLAALGCGGGQRPAVAPDGAIPEVGLPDRGADEPASDGVLSASGFAARYCALLAPCCNDLDRCRQAVEAMSPYRATMARACLEAVGAASTTAHLCTQGFLTVAPVCQLVFAAKVATRRLGQPCVQTEDCLLSPQGPVRCAGEGGMGRCQVLLPGAPGSAPCVATVSGPVTVPSGDLTSTAIMGYLCNVADGLWCDDLAGKCAAIRPAGASCTSFGECGPGGYCDDGSGKCTARKAEGAACTVDEECPSTLCGENNRCAPPSLVDPGLAQLCVRP
jgi:hypothetical protein